MEHPDKINEDTCQKLKAHLKRHNIGFEEKKMGGTTIIKIISKHQKEKDRFGKLL